MLKGPLHYATYFDRYILSRGLALYASLVRHSPPFRLWVLCLDEVTAEVLRALALPEVELVPLRELEQADPALPAVKAARKPIEYYWTCGPAYLLHLFEQQPEIELLTLLDADQYLFNDVGPLFEELGEGTILAIPMRYSPRGALLGSGSRFQVGFNGFRRSAETLACLQRWRAQCLEWCYDRFDQGRYGDQGYLNDWAERYQGLVASTHHGAGIAPWNLANFRLSAPNGRLEVDGVPLLSYHFSEIRVLRPWLYEPGLWTRRVPVTHAVKHQLYAPYARALRQASRQARAVRPDLPTRDSRPRRRDETPLRQMLRHRTFLIVTDRFAL